MNACWLVGTLLWLDTLQTYAWLQIIQLPVLHGMDIGARLLRNPLTWHAGCTEPSVQRLPSQKHSGAAMAVHSSSSLATPVAPYLCLCSSLTATIAARQPSIMNDSCSERPLVGASFKWWGSITCPCCLLVPLRCCLVSSVHLKEHATHESFLCDLASAVNAGLPTQVCHLVCKCVSVSVCTCLYVSVCDGSIHISFRDMIRGKRPACNDDLGCACLQTALMCGRKWCITTCINTWVQFAEIHSLTHYHFCIFSWILQHFVDAC